jgi:hypothetical protein
MIAPGKVTAGLAVLARITPQISQRIR